MRNFPWKTRYFPQCTRLALNLLRLTVSERWWRPRPWQAEGLAAGGEGRLASRNQWSGAMKQGRLADFFFAGLGIVPAVLAFNALPDLAILLFVPLLFAACLFGMAEQVMTGEPVKGAGGRAGGDVSAPQPPDGLALRDRAATDNSPKT
jgi:hypothetical protein